MGCQDGDMASVNANLRRQLDAKLRSCFTHDTPGRPVR